MLELVSRSDVLIEGFRPGVAERLGLGPEVCLDRNPKLVYGADHRLWPGRTAGERGRPRYQLHRGHRRVACDRSRRATTRLPINLVGDFGGGALYLALGILAALHEAKSSGKGQVVDAAMVDGVASLMTQPHGTFAAGMMTNERGTNVTDSGAPFYDVYECSDGRWIALGAVEEKFYAAALRVLGLEALLAEQWNRNAWPAAKAAIAARVKTRTRDEWTRAFEGIESCFAPVLTLDEAPRIRTFASAGLISRSTASSNPRRRRASAEPLRLLPNLPAHGLRKKPKTSSRPGWTNPMCWRRGKLARSLSCPPVP